jgi:hypothetical protein
MIRRRNFQMKGKDTLKECASNSKQIADLCADDEKRNDRIALRGSGNQNGNLGSENRR